MITERFDIGDIPCKALMPDDGIVALAVLAVHGFAGDKESSVIAALAEELCAKEQAAVYCFDFPAHGAHPSDELSVSACADALESVAQFVSRRHADARHAVFATSFGGYMALRCLDRLSRALGEFSLVLRAPAVKMAQTLEGILGEEGLAQIERAGFVEAGFERKLLVRKGFLEELKEFDACRAYDRPMLVIHGDRDDVVLPADIARFMEMNPLAKLVRIPGADHRFKGEGQVAAVIDAARRFLAAS
jgi:pimeloyl-ACP methyl ester carboxylesterase